MVPLVEIHYLFSNSGIKKEMVVERVLRTTADIFGHVGEHRGIRDRWEAHCSSLAIKSVIGN